MKNILFILILFATQPTLAQLPNNNTEDNGVILLVESNGVKLYYQYNKEYIASNMSKPNDKYTYYRVLYYIENTNNYKVCHSPLNALTFEIRVSFYKKDGNLATNTVKILANHLATSIEPNSTLVRTTHLRSDFGLFLKQVPQGVKYVKTTKKCTPSTSDTKS